jgi:hypothetical protein
MTKSRGSAILQASAIMISPTIRLWLETWKLWHSVLGIPTSLFAEEVGEDSGRRVYTKSCFTKVKWRARMLYVNWNILAMRPRIIYSNAAESPEEFTDSRSISFEAERVHDRKWKREGIFIPLYSRRFLLIEGTLPGRRIAKWTPRECTQLLYAVASLEWIAYTVAYIHWSVGREYWGFQPKGKQSDNNLINSHLLIWSNMNHGSFAGVNSGLRLSPRQEELLLSF